MLEGFRMSAEKMGRAWGQPPGNQFGTSHLSKRSPGPRTPGAGPLDQPRRWIEPAQGILIMGVLMVKCPACGRESSTGIQIEQDSLEKLPDWPARARCPACRTEHSWSPREARFVDAIPASQWVEAIDPLP
jgi:endogenous inhibitor of DNA gyrase (YacG/DUF329 family)